MAIETPRENADHAPSARAANERSSRVLLLAWQLTRHLAGPWIDHANDRVRQQSISTVGLALASVAFVGVQAAAIEPNEAKVQAIVCVQVGAAILAGGMIRQRLGRSAFATIACTYLATQIAFALASGGLTLPVALGLLWPLVAISHFSHRQTTTLCALVTGLLAAGLMAFAPHAKTAIAPSLAPFWYDAARLLLFWMAIVGVAMLGIARRALEAQARQELARARSQADAASRAKSSFLAAMSHEIRTPMNGVIGLLSVLESSKLETEQRQTLESIRASGESLLAIINDILDFSKVEAGKMELETVSFDLIELVEQAMQTFSSNAAQKDLELAWEIDEEVAPRRLGDPSRLRQILLNLVSNALKFTRQGGVIIRVHAAEFGNLRFEVTDTGIGISPESRRALFEPFHQATVATTRVFGGTGLGLSISKQLVRLMNGRIDCTSESGKGSTFWFEIPLAPDPQFIDYSFQRKRAVALHGYRVIVAVRGALTSEALKTALQAGGATVLLADQAPLAIEDLRQWAASDPQPPCLVIADLALANEGYQQLAVARSALTVPALPPMIALGLPLQVTAPVEDEVLGAGAWIRRPVQRRQLWLAIEEAVRHAKRGFSAANGQEISAHSASESHHDGRRTDDPSILPTPTDVSKTAAEHLQAARVLQILVVEDNPVNRQVAARILAKLGHEVHFAENGELGLQACKAQIFDVVLMDIQMPVMDGLTATSHLRQDSRYDNVPVIALTANAMAEDRRRCLDHGADDFVAKPVRLSDLDAALQRWKNGRHNGRPPGDSQAA